jgi:hypothetical protein
MSRKPLLTRVAAAVSTLIALGLCACHPAPAPLPAPARPFLAPAAPPATTTATATAVAPEEPPVPLPPLIARPAEVACAWTTVLWPGRELAWLRLRPQGPLFARITRGGRAQLQIPVGAHEHGILDVASDGLVVTGVVAREQIKLFAAHAFAMNGVVFPISTSPLSWTEGFSDGVSVTMAVPKEVLVAHPPLLAKRPCTDLTLDRGASLDMENTVFGAQNGADKRLRGGGAIEVFSDPGRPAEVKLVLETDTAIDSFASAGAFSRIGVYLDTAFVAGWVKTVHLKDAVNGGRGFPFGTSGVGVGDVNFKPLVRVVCSADVPVVAEAGGESANVGFIRANTSTEVLEHRGSFDRVYVKSRGIHLAESAVLLARASDLTACRKLEPSP